MRPLFRIHDKGHEEGCHLVESEAEARSYNARGWGIFRTVQEFMTPVRRKENLEKVRSWAVEIDLGVNNTFQSKEEALEHVCDFLYPTLVIETRNGIHVYFDAKDADPNEYPGIVGDRLVPILGADPAAKDLSRILREPGFFHHKAEPFRVQKVMENPVSYSTAEMMMVFKLDEPADEFVAKERHEMRSHFQSEDVLERMFESDQMEMLSRLSGTGAVLGERYTFHPVSGGKFNIKVNGKGTSCWIDAKKKIGSLSQGGPTIWQWLRWLGHSGQDCYQILKGEFPELWMKSI